MLSSRSDEEVDPYIDPVSRLLCSMMTCMGARGMRGWLSRLGGGGDFELANGFAAGSDRVSLRSYTRAYLWRKRLQAYA